MWKAKITVHHRPHCEDMDYLLRISVPVCRDEMREKYSRMKAWEKHGWDFERLPVEDECPVCQQSIETIDVTSAMKEAIRRLFKL